MSRIKTTSKGFGRKPNFSDIVGAVARARKILREGVQDVLPGETYGYIIHPLADDRGINALSTPRWLLFRHELAKMLINRNTPFTAVG